MAFQEKKGAGSPLRSFTINNCKYIIITELIDPSRARCCMCHQVHLAFLSSTGLNLQENLCSAAYPDKGSSSYTIYSPLRILQVSWQAALQDPAQSDTTAPVRFEIVCTVSLFITTLVAPFSQMQVQVIILSCIILQIKPKLFRSTAAVV